MFKTIRDSLSLLNAARKGQKIETRDSDQGREYVIVINR